MIVGEKVNLCGITKESSNKIYEWVNNPELKRYTGTIYPVSEFEHEKWIENKMQSKNEKIFLICTKKDSEPIGTIGLKNIDFINSNVELYISIGNNNFKNKGFGTDAVITLTDFCFVRLGLHKVYLRVFESNKEAIHCYEKSGYLIEGKLQEQHFDGGKFENVLIMAKISN